MQSATLFHSPIQTRSKGGFSVPDFAIQNLVFGYTKWKLSHLRCRLNELRLTFLSAWYALKTLYHCGTCDPSGHVPKRTQFCRIPRHIRIMIGQNRKLRNNIVEKVIGKGLCEKSLFGTRRNINGNLSNRA